MEGIVIFAILVALVIIFVARGLLSLSRRKPSSLNDWVSSIVC